MKTGLMGLLAAMAMVVSVAWAEPADPAANPVTGPAAATPAPATAPPKTVERAAPAKPAAEPPKAAKPAVEPPKPAKPASPPPPTEPVAEKAAAGPVSVPADAGGSSGLVCWLIGFAMLVIGFAAGFIARHLVSRRQLGGMTVRIGTWRGIP